MGCHKKTTQGVDHWTTLSGIAYYFGLLWCKKIYTLHKILTKTHKQRSLDQCFLLDLFWFTLLILLSIYKWQLNEYLLNNILFEVLLKYFSSNPIILSCARHSIHLFKIQISAAFHCTVISHTKIIWTFFSCDFTIATADVITYYIVCLSFPSPQVKFSWVFQVY